MSEDKQNTDIQKLTFLVEDTYVCSSEYKESLKERLGGLSVDQLGTPRKLGEGYHYCVVGKGDSGQEVSIGVSSLNKLSKEQAIKEAWFNIISTFQWKIKD